jgi:hypothetical protein
MREQAVPAKNAIARRFLVTVLILPVNPKRNRHSLTSDRPGVQATQRNGSVYRVIFRSVHETFAQNSDAVG